MHLRTGIKHSMVMLGQVLFSESFYEKEREEGMSGFSLLHRPRPTDRAFRPSVHPIRHAGGVGKEREGTTTTFSSVKKGEEKYGQKIHA